MKTKRDCITLIELRTCLLEAEEGTAGQEEELNRIEEDLAAIRAQEAGLLTDLAEAITAIRYGGKYPYIARTEEAVKKLGELLPYLRQIFPVLHTVRWKDVQFVVVNEAQRSTLEAALKESLEKWIRESIDLQRVISAVEKLKAV